MYRYIPAGTLLPLTIGIEVKTKNILKKVESLKES